MNSPLSSSELTLYGNRFYPVTSGMSFVAGKAEDVVSAFDLWKLDSNKIESRFGRCDGTFESALCALEPLDGTKMLLVQTSNPAWTAVLSNHWQGGQQFHQASIISERLRVDRVDIGVSFPSTNEETGRGRKPSCHFAYSIPVLKTLGDAAHVQVSDQGNHTPKWQYDHSPNYMPFEDVDAYQRRRITDRFTPEMLVDYCRDVGLEIFNEEFYDGPIFMVEQRQRNGSPSGIPGAPRSYHEVQSWFGLERVKE